LDGIYATVAQVISVMLPPLLIFFPLFALLEDVGYLPRLAFLLERRMHRCGGCGKQALTLCMGLGCNAVGVTGCRIISSPRQRLAAILTNAMVPCNGRFPALIIVATLFFGDALGALAVAGAVVLGLVGAVVCTGFLNRSVLRHCPHEAGFLMEIPPLRRPQLRNILARSLLDRTLHVAGRALAVAAPAGAVLWVLENTNCLAWLCGLLDPLGRLLGMNGAILVGFFLSFPANELFLPVLLMTLGATSETALATAGITWQMAMCIMIFMVFHWPCATTLLTVRKETGSLKKTAAAALLPTAVGMILCLMANILL
jgi:ferrous iron transport protein B